mmetsp:Transcript_73215/g.136818  ORF Transcript_73215/g.136818 Transcript_73215/m.136818 type:complete len:213 (+) Transcript_73215:538-1176(+)
MELALLAQEQGRGQGVAQGQPVLEDVLGQLLAWPFPEDLHPQAIAAALLAGLSIERLEILRVRKPGTHSWTATLSNPLPPAQSVGSLSPAMPLTAEPNLTGQCHPGPASSSALQGYPRQRDLRQPVLCSASDRALPEASSPEASSPPQPARPPWVEQLEPGRLASAAVSGFLRSLQAASSDACPPRTFSTLTPSVQSHPPAAPSSSSSATSP